MRPARPYQTLALLLLLLALVRGLFVLCLGDVFFYGEELEKGAVAKALLDGLDLPYWELPFHYYEGGGFVVSHLKALAFLLVGENVLGQKIASIWVTMATLACGYVFLARHFSTRAGLLFGLFFVFGPDAFQRIGLLGVGTHADAMLFLLLIFDRAFGVVWKDETRPRHLFVLGLVTGFGVYYSYQVPMIAAVAFTMVAARLRLRLLGPLGLSLFLGLLVGALPWLVMMVATSGAHDIHGSSLLARRLNVDRFGSLVTSMFRDKGPRELIGALIHPATTALALWAALRFGGRATRVRLLALFAYVLVWFAVFATSEFVMPEIYHFHVWLRLAPLWMASLVVLAVGLATLVERKGRLGWLCAAPLLAVGAAHSLATMAGGSPGTPLANLRELLAAKGYDYVGYFARLYPRLEGTEQERLALLLTFDEDAPPLLRGSVAWAVFTDPLRPPSEIRDVLNALAPDHADDFVRGLGPYWIRRNGWDLEAAFESAGRVGGRTGELLLEAVGRMGSSYKATPDCVEADIRAFAGRPGAEPYLRGAGFRIARALVYGPHGEVGFHVRPEAARAFIAGLPAAARPYLSEGFEEALGWMKLGGG